MENSDLQIFVAERIKFFRKEQGLSQERLSELAGLGTKAIQNIENRKYDFKIQTISKILAALDISKEKFFGISFLEDNPQVSELVYLIEQFPPEKQDVIVKSFIDISKNID